MRAGLALLLLAGALCAAPATVSADADRPSPLPLRLPIDCLPGFNCWVLNHFDLDPGPGRRDYRCGTMTNDAHEGTGFALANMAWIEANVAVRASAGGVVVATRDDMPDVNVRKLGPDAVKGRECGNGVRIDHGDGWETQYCHLKRGSVSVAPGQRVEAGERLGAVGLSGNTDHPHVLLVVSRHGEKLDPFRGVDGGPRCGRGDVPLWDETARRALRDEAPILIDLGFATHVLSREQAESGRARETTAGVDAESLLLWARVAGVEPGDILMFTIVAPDGRRLVADAGRATRAVMMQFRYAGRHRRTDAWAPGTYTGTVMLRREGRLTRIRTVSIKLTETQ